MKRVFLSIVLAGAVSSAFAQKSEVTAAKNDWGLFQLTSSSASTPLAKKLEALAKGLAHTDKAIADEKSKVMPEAWSYRALFASSAAILDSTSTANADANLKIAQDAVVEAKKLDTKGSEKDNINLAETNISNAVRNGGVIAYNKKDYKTAYQKFVAATVINPNDTAMYLNAGIAARLSEDYPNMISQFKKVISLNSPQSKDLYSEIISTTLAKQKDTTAALAVIKEASAKFPENTDWIKTETQIYIDRGDAAKSEQMLVALAAKEPNNPNYQVLLGNIYFSQALKLQADRNKIDPKKVKEFNEVTGKMNALLDKSLPFYKKALEVDAKNQGALETLKTIYAFRNDTKNYEDIKKRLDALPKQ
ncbi:Beta-barrel assembly-enhancing protease [Pedobacter sp. Bi27]|uniref:tetratricopeptide repeat protein n=1 Tax=unclassified Pedobacter TaxID=2628915 RepID=UPI001D7BEF80|nr:MULTISPECIES: tetratricopeptide repeat protein [unclassified Pedobacter]CAH0143731.1 Beta-barrel assembly-enhancing protease [Pedobacter sp. Bi36]CAH0199592.1 Beta-barrel assembly-enhancing protease [Pedobacter sp. Bi126]CAH0258321.1 Beta-barrel assembly-enhancing protease [Pedobacter sp. Bi27]